MAIRKKRHALNISQEELADLAGIHRTYISSIELGKVDVGITIAYKVAIALNLPLSTVIKSVEQSL